MELFNVVNHASDKCRGFGRDERYGSWMVEVRVAKEWKAIPQLSPDSPTEARVWGEPKVSWASDGGRDPKEFAVHLARAIQFVEDIKEGLVDLEGGE